MLDQASLSRRTIAMIGRRMRYGPIYQWKMMYLYQHQELALNANIYPL